MSVPNTSSWGCPQHRFRVTHITQRCTFPLIPWAFELFPYQPRSINDKIPNRVRETGKRESCKVPQTYFSILSASEETHHYREAACLLSKRVTSRWHHPARRDRSHQIPYYFYGGERGIRSHPVLSASSLRPRSERSAPCSAPCMPSTPCLCLLPLTCWVIRWKTLERVQREDFSIDWKERLVRASHQRSQRSSTPHTGCTRPDNSQDLEEVKCLYVEVN